MPRLRKPSTLPALALLALSCASAGAGGNHDTQLRRELNGYQLPRPLAAVWPDALRVLSDRGAQLVGKDRAVVGQPAQDAQGQPVARGFETRDLGGGRWVAESSADGGHLRYRVQGTDLGHGSSLVRYVAVQGNAQEASEDASRSLDLELELVRRVDPAAAARMLAAAAP